MKLRARLRGWRKKHTEEIHNLMDAISAGVGTVFIGLGAVFLALWVVCDLDWGVLGTGCAALFVGGFNIRLSFAAWRKK